MNLVTPEFMKNRGLEVGSIQDLNYHDGYIPLSSLGGKITEPLGYVILQVQILYVPSYDEDQVALVVSEDSNFLGRVLYTHTSSPTTLSNWTRRITV